MSKNPKERIKELRTLLHHYNVEYYVHSRSLISDFEFDHLMKELEELEEKLKSIETGVYCYNVD